ncbi:MAG: hypothetical protein IJJ06_10130 [Mogibacterium sp.]|nr:hypothetical protein [Mogibacterium sp.]
MKKIVGLLIICLSLVMLSACRGGVDKAASSIPENPGNVYRVITCDESGAPVAGVMVQLCSDAACQMEETDTNGIATFDASEGIYTVHVYSVPEGFAEDETEYSAPESYGDVNITINTAK